MTLLESGLLLDVLEKDLDSMFLGGGSKELIFSEKIEIDDHSLPAFLSAPTIGFKVENTREVMDALDIHNCLKAFMWLTSPQAKVVLALASCSYQLSLQVANKSGDPSEIGEMMGFLTGLISRSEDVLCFGNDPDVVARVDAFLEKFPLPIKHPLHVFKAGGK